MLEYVNQEEDKPNEEVTEETDLSISAVSNPPKKRKVAASLFSDFTAAKDSRRTPVHDIVLSEIRRYAEEDLLDYDSNPQEWWGSHKNAYPILAKLVSKYWCIPATSVRLEELFSLAGNVLSQRCNRLLPQNLDYLFFFK